MHTNINGLAPKFNMLVDLHAKLKWDIMCITETHLLPSISSSIVDIPGYTLLRHDVCGHVQKHGVCCYIQNRLSIDHIIQPLPNLLSFRLSSLNTFVLVVYRPPSNSPDSNDRLNQFILHFCCGKEVIVLGDFNLPGIDWPIQVSHCPPLERMFLDTFLSLGLHQWISEPTYPRSGNILDLIFTSEADRIGSLDIMAPLPGCDHCAISFDYIFDASPSLNSVPGHTIPQRAWHRGKYQAANRMLSNIDWDLELAFLDSDQSFKRFAEILNDVCTECIPLKPPSEGRPPWSTNPPTSLIKRRHAAWSRYKSVRHQLGRHSGEARSMYASFASLNQQCRKFAVQAQAKYEEDLISKSKENPKLFHSYIRKKKT
ncbi:uncharacterized protein LOC122392429 [Amphibalanus amphitrite]|uniref:uncharacterized protein LOC122392429 n=1 Tax=Amphibalanus amphitrite TaxID=1232801 RepID=UPI001C8FDC6C|nr:uncharacterized protein LOC122392429 [Amphibalanus amphitrite]